MFRYERTIIHMRFSIIIPCYNSEKTIGRTIKSILNQSFSDYEVIIVNDGSTDKSEEAIKSFLDDKRIKLLNKENGGLTTAIAAGISQAQGEYILQLDADDTFIDAAFSTIDKELYDCDILSFVFNNVDENGKFISKETHKARFYKNKLEVNELLPKLYKDNNSFEGFKYLSVHRWAIAIKTSLAKEVAKEYLKWNFSLYEDMCFVMLAASQASSIKIIDEAFIDYYQVRLTHSRRMEDSYEKLLELREKLRSFLNEYSKNNNIDPSCFDTMEFDVSKFYLSRLIRKTSYKEAKVFYKKLKKDSLYKKGLKITKAKGESLSRKIYLFLLKANMFSAIYFYFKKVAI